MNITTMSSKSPIFPMPQPQHFSDYGFDPQIDYFQVLEEARKHKTRSIDSIHFKLQKPFSKDDLFSKKSQNNKKSKKRWWRSALFFFKWKWPHNNNNNSNNKKSYSYSYSYGYGYGYGCGYEDVHQARARAFRSSISGPIYVTDSRSGPTTPRRSSGRSASGPLAGTLSPAESDIPYVSLRQLNMERQQRVSTSAMPIYLVT